MNTNESRHLCPKCSAELNQQMACACGFGSPDGIKLLLVRRDRLLLYSYIALSIFLLLAAVQAHHWGPFAAEIPVLKVKQMVGALDQKAYHRIIEICSKRGKINCVKNTYGSLYSKLKNVETLAELAQFELQIHETDAAIVNFKSYYDLGGKNPNVALHYALALEQKSDFKNAIKYLNLSIAQNPERLSAQATQELLRILILQQNYVQAQHLIRNFWASAENAKGYFNREADELQKILGAHKLGGRVVAGAKSI